ncbi:cytochrome P450 [Schizophyllum commune Tattone D]|nr:cytochrome P450 [Schizophyllum commune Tattone D]
MGPNSLHFSNPEVYSKVYTRGTSFVKSHALYRGFSQPMSSFGSVDPAFAKARRDVISPLFSRRAILKLEPFIREKVDKFTRKLLESKDTSKPVDVSRAIRSMTFDIIYSYCFGECYDALDAPNFSHPIIIDAELSSSYNLVFKAIPGLLPLQALVVKLLKPFGRAVPGRAQMRTKLLAQIDRLLRDPSALEDAPHETVYHYLLRPHPEKGFPDIPPRSSLLDEAMNLQLAGSHTTANASIVGCYHILNNRKIHTRLVAELKEAIPDPQAISFEVVEKLPYLTAVIKESLRLSHGVVSPMLRVVNADDTELDGIAVPRGTSVAIGNSFVHLNPDIFPDPYTFKPERWMGEDSSALENYLVPFSRGQRNCLGMNLAWCELYLIFSSMYRRVDLELCNSSPEDMIFRAHFIPVFPPRPVRAIVRGIAT